MTTGQVDGPWALVDSNFKFCFLPSFLLKKNEKKGWGERGAEKRKATVEGVLAVPSAFRAYVSAILVSSRVISFVTVVKDGDDESF